jgi:hypothetical protein
MKRQLEYNARTVLHFLKEGGGKWRRLVSLLGKQNGIRKRAKVKKNQ